jgi:hypothetical protein
MFDLFVEGQKVVIFKKINMGQTKEQQQRHFNKKPISELLRKVDSIQASLKLLPPSNNGMSSLLFSLDE